MTNRDRYIMTKNEYDRLCMVQAALREGCNCVIDALTGSFYSCPEGNIGVERCYKCIAEWLNKKER